MFLGAAFWLVVSSVFGLIASIKFHSPNFLADSSYLTYGRVHPAATNALLYGFAIQAGLGVLLAIFARQGKALVVHPVLVGVGAKLWNLGVLLGILGILRGSNTGFENFEMPRFAVCILFGAYLLIAVLAMLTLHSRQERALQPSQWFLLTALLWFPWIYSTANLLLLKFQVRGVTQNIIAWWFSANLIYVWFSLVGIAALFYLIPKFVNRPLHSSYLALFTFWTLLFFGSWTGIPSGAPVPAWMPALSATATVVMIVPVIAVMMNLKHTIRGDCAPLKANVAGSFIKFSLPVLLLATLMNAAGVLPGVSAVTNLTWFTVASVHLQIYGFFAMAMFAVVYYLVPHIAGIDYCPKLARAHFWVMVLGVLLLVVPLAICGVMEGMKWNDATIPSVDVAKSTLTLLRIATTGELLIALGNLLFFLNLLGVAVAFAKKLCLACCANMVGETKIAEVQA